MIKIEFLGPINKESMQLTAANLAEVKNALSKCEDLREWLKISAVAINGKIAKNLDEELKDGDIISILPPVCGG